MYFTKEDYIKIENWLKKRTVKDSQFPVVQTFNEGDFITMLKNDTNVLIPIKVFVNRLRELEIPDFYNITVKNNIEGITLEEAIQLIPVEQRKIGLVITYLDENYKWNIMQFKGLSVNQWNEIGKWRELFEGYFDDYVYHPDNEDIEGIFKNGTRLLRLKDRVYNKSLFSGKGTKVIRKRLIGSEACTIDDEDHYENKIYQYDFETDNTIYIIRYDFTLAESIIIPKESVIIFDGGTITGQSINLNECKILGMVGRESDYFIDVEVSNWAKGQLEYRDDTIKVWNGTEWISLKDTTNIYTKEEINTLIESLNSKFVTKEAHNFDIEALTRIFNDVPTLDEILSLNNEITPELVQELYDNLD